MSRPRWRQLRRWLPLRCLLVALAGLLSLGVWWSGWEALQAARQQHDAELARLRQAEQLPLHWQRRQALAAGYAPIWQQLRNQGRLAAENRLLALETLSTLSQRPGVDSLSYQLGPRQPLDWRWPSPAAAGLCHSSLQLTFRLVSPTLLPDLLAGLDGWPGLLLPAHCQWRQISEGEAKVQGECRLGWVSACPSPAPSR